MTVLLRLPAEAMVFNKSVHRQHVRMCSMCQLPHSAARACEGCLRSPWHVQVCTTPVSAALAARTERALALHAQLVAARLRGLACVATGAFAQADAAVPLLQWSSATVDVSSWWRKFHYPLCFSSDHVCHMLTLLNAHLDARCVTWSARYFQSRDCPSIYVIECMSMGGF